jgi:flavin reductase (DIM6/NTAB) family NADH-FMN oxidoreductase RutF
MELLNINKALSELTKPDHPVLVISGRRNEGMNIMVAGWVMRTSFKPPLIAVSIGKTRYTHKMLEKYSEFVLAYPVKGHEKIIDFCGSKSGRSVNKFEVLDIKSAAAQKVNLVIIENAQINFECRLKEKIKTGDHTIFVGEVVAASGNPKKKPLLNVGNYTYKEFKSE